MTQQDIYSLLSAVTHPENGQPLNIKNLTVAGNKVQFTILLSRARDPFGTAIKREAARRIAERFQDVEITVFLEEPAPKEVKQKQPSAKTPDHTGKGYKVIAIASGKGGVGKSTVTANIAVALASQGYRVGVLDADIYGPSQPALFGVEGYMPSAVRQGEQDMMVPAESRGVKIMSIAFFINSSDALVWRGPMATNALRQMIHQTLWGDMDFLLIDLPPGTGDVHLTVLQELKVDGAVIVTTPQRIALADVVRGIAMFRAEKINIPIVGIVENMAWFTPAELPANRYYIFGRGGVEELASKEKLPVIGRIPLILPEGKATEGGVLWNVDNKQIKESYRAVTESIIKTV